jgi:hypothetical protein
MMVKPENEVEVMVRINHGSTQIAAGSEIYVTCTYCNSFPNL